MAHQLTISEVARQAVGQVDLEDVLVQQSAATDGEPRPTFWVDEDNLESSLARVRAEVLERLEDVQGNCTARTVSVEDVDTWLDNIRSMVSELQDRGLYGHMFDHVTLYGGEVPHGHSKGAPVTVVSVTFGLVEVFRGVAAQADKGCEPRGSYITGHSGAGYAQSRDEQSRSWTLGHGYRLRKWHDDRRRFRAVCKARGYTHFLDARE